MDGASDSGMLLGRLWEAEVRDRWMGDPLVGLALLALLGGAPAWGQDGLATVLDYDLGHVAAREIAGFGYAITGDLIEPHAHGRRICYEPHLPDLPPLRITYMDDYQETPTGAVQRYRHAHHHGNVVQEHAHFYEGQHDHRPGSEHDYLAAYERFQRTERPGEFDEFTFVLERFERKVPTYRIHGSAPNKPRPRPEPAGDSRNGDVAAVEKEMKVEEPVASAAGDGEGEAAGDAPELDEIVDERPDDDVAVIETGTEIFIRDDHHRDRIVDDYRNKRRKDRHDFDKQTHNRLDPSKNRRADKRPKPEPHQPDLSERIQAQNADLGARIENGSIERAARMDQRVMEVMR